MILYCLTSFLYEFDNGKSTLNNSALKFAADEQALYLTWKQASRDFFCRPIIAGDLEKVGKAWPKYYIRIQKNPKRKLKDRNDIQPKSNTLVYTQRQFIEYRPICLNLKMKLLRIYISYKHIKRRLKLLGVFLCFFLKSLLVACPTQTNPPGSGRGTGGIVFDKHIDKSTQQMN